MEHYKFNIAIARRNTIRHWGSSVEMNNVQSDPEFDSPDPLPSISLQIILMHSDSDIINLIHRHMLSKDKTEAESTEGIEKENYGQRSATLCLSL